MMLLVRCPNCKNQMKYNSTKKVSDMRKKCVFCPKSFGVKDNIIKQL